jgi:hypothetical protein
MTLDVDKDESVDGRHPRGHRGTGPTDRSDDGGDREAFEGIADSMDVRVAITFRAR